MIELEITDEQALAAYGDLPKQANFAMVEALNEVAFGERKQVFQPEVQERFSLKNRFLTKGLRPGAEGPGGIGVRKATKALPEAKIFYGKGAEFLSLHEAGGLKLPPSGEESFGVPEPSFAKGKIVRRSRILLQLRLGQAGASGGRYFEAGKGTPRHRVMERLRGRQEGQTDRFDRRGNLVGKRKIRSRQVRTVLWMEPKARIPKVLQVERRGHAYAVQQLPIAFAKHLARALRTRRA